MKPDNSPISAAIPSRLFGASRWHAFVPNCVDGLAKVCKKAGSCPTLDQVVASAAVLAASARCADVAYLLNPTKHSGPELDIDMDIEM